MYSFNSISSLKRQSGVALAISLIILLVLTMVVVSSTQKVVVQERMAAAVRDAHVALQGAEAGLRYAEELLFFGDPTVAGSTGVSGLSGFDNTNGLFSTNNGPTDLFSDLLWGSANVRNITVDGQEVQFFVESLGQTSSASSSSGAGLVIQGYGGPETSSTVHVFRTVAHAAGISGNADRVVIAYYEKAFTGTD